ncbi:MAG TPA: carbohydrate binding domain-containing protein, partial [Candidatus Limnocylindrales bacterium]|nr:carbohydrate binding domain-containing protein [Candidatus Limnocylindrales bacterium]
VTGVVANGISLIHQNGDIWNGTIIAEAGTHSVNVSASDNAGNIVWDKSTSYTGTTPPVPDLSNPVINNVTLNHSNPGTGNAILVTVNATDNIGITGVVANGASLTNQDGHIWNGTITALVGTHSVNVSASDAASNTGWNNSTSYTATTPPIPDTLNSINVTPDPKTMVIGETQTFIASPKDKYGAPLSISVTWSSSNTTVGTVDAGTGYFTALVLGTVMVNATNGSITGTANVTVNARPTSTNQIINPGFESGTSDWNSWGVSFATDPPTSEGTKSANIGIVSRSSNMQLYQYGITLEPNTRYRLSFAAFSNTGHDMIVKLFKHGSPYTGYGLIQNYDLSIGWQEFSTEFTTAGFSSKVSDARLMFWFVPFGKSGDEYYIDNVRLEKFTSQDITPPTITGGTPTGINVQINTQITVTFSEAMNQASAQSSFSTSIHPELNPAIIGSFSWSGNTMTYTLSSNLNNSKTYNATVGTGARDLAGNSLQSPYNWEFTTIAAQPPSINIIKNPGFESGTTPWIFYTNGTGKFTASPPGYEGNNAGNIVIYTGGTNVQLYQTKIPLEPHTSYRLRFVAKSTTGHDLNVNVLKHGSPFTSYGLDQRFDLNKDWQEFSTEFTTTGFTGTVTDARLMFYIAPFGEAGDKYYIDDVRLEKI